MHPKATQFGLVLSIDPTTLPPTQLRTMLSQHGVLCFREQLHLTESDQQAVMSAFGTIQDWQEQQAPISARSQESDSVINLHNADFLGTTRMAWHTDQTYRASNYLPVRSLYAYDDPTPGNVTSFLDIKPLTAIITQEYPELLHAIGRYFIGGGHTSNVTRPVFSYCKHLNQHVYRLDSRMEFVTQVDVDKIKKLLVDFITSAPKYNHQWNRGDFVIFDNNQCPHRRTTMVGECKLHRLTSTFWLVESDE